jgi:hypothetical protein
MKHLSMNPTLTNLDANTSDRTSYKRSFLFFLFELHFDVTDTNGLARLYKHRISDCPLQPFNITFSSYSAHSSSQRSMSSKIVPDSVPFAVQESY